MRLNTTSILVHLAIEHRLYHRHERFRALISLLMLLPVAPMAITRTCTMQNLSAGVQQAQNLRDITGVVYDRPRNRDQRKKHRSVPMARFENFEALFIACAQVP